MGLLALAALLLVALPAPLAAGCHDPDACAGGAADPAWHLVHRVHAYVACTLDPNPDVCEPQLTWGASARARGACT